MRPPANSPRQPRRTHTEYRARYMRDPSISFDLLLFLPSLANGSKADSHHARPVASAIALRVIGGSSDSAGEYWYFSTCSHNDSCVKVMSKGENGSRLNSESCRSIVMPQETDDDSEDQSRARRAISAAPTPSQRPTYTTRACTVAARRFAALAACRRMVQAPGIRDPSISLDLSFFFPL